MRAAAGSSLSSSRRNSSSSSSDGCGLIGGSLWSSSLCIYMPRRRKLLAPNSAASCFQSVGSCLYIYLPNSEATCMLVYILPAVYFSLIKDCLIYYITRSFSTSINVGHIGAVSWKIYCNIVTLIVEVLYCFFASDYYVYVSVEKKQWFILFGLIGMFFSSFLGTPTKWIMKG